MSTCRSCGAPLKWVKTRSGKNMPLDAVPTPQGDFYLMQDTVGGVTEGHHVKSYPGKLPEDVPRYTSHFATCPNADRHRRS